MHLYTGKYIDVGSITGETIAVEDSTYMKTNLTHEGEAVIVPMGTTICHLCDYTELDGDLTMSMDGWFVCGPNGALVEFVDVDDAYDTTHVICPVGTQIKIVDQESGVFNPGTLAIKFLDVNYFS